MALIDQIKLALQNIANVTGTPVNWATQFTTALNAPNNAGIADETKSGVVQLATAAEVTAGTVANRAVSPLRLAGLQATSSLKGLAQFSTSAEAITGTATDRAVTPAALTSFIRAAPLYAADFTALKNLYSQVSDGTVVAVGRCQMAAGGWHDYSLWQKVAYYNAFQPISRIDTDNTGAVGRSARDNITDLAAAAGSNFSVPLDTRSWERVQKIECRWDGASVWKAWNWSNIGTSEWLQSQQNGVSLDTNGGDTSMSIAEGVVFLNLNLYRSASNIQLDTSYITINSGYRPQYAAHGYVNLYPGGNGKGMGGFAINTDGTFTLQYMMGGSNFAAMRGSVFYRAL